MEDSDDKFKCQEKRQKNIMTKYNSNKSLYTDPTWFTYLCLIFKNQVNSRTICKTGTAEPGAGMCTLALDFKLGG